MECKGRFLAGSPRLPVMPCRRRWPMVKLRGAAEAGSSVGNMAPGWDRLMIAQLKLMQLNGARLQRAMTMTIVHRCGLRSEVGGCSGTGSSRVEPRRPSCNTHHGATHISVWRSSTWMQLSATLLRFQHCMDRCQRCPASEVEPTVKAGWSTHHGHLLLPPLALQARRCRRGSEHCTSGFAEGDACESVVR
jgi:hypothetical protein